MSKESTYGRRQALAIGGAVATAGMLLNTPVARAEVTQAGGVAPRRVTFRAPDDVRLVGHLRVPPGTEPRPAVVVSNAMTSVKEQSVNAGYAQRLAAAGFVTLVFDQRGFGESGGGPRQHEDNRQRLADLHVAISYLTGLPVVDADRIGALGVSIGGGLAMNLSAYDSRVRTFVAVAAGLLNPARARALMVAAYPAMLADQTALLERYHRTASLDQHRIRWKIGQECPATANRTANPVRPTSRAAFAVCGAAGSGN